MKKCEFYERKGYLNYYSFQCVFEDFFHFNIYNKHGKYIGKKLVRKSKEKEFKRVNIKFTNEEVISDQIDDNFKFFINNEIFVTLFMKSGELSGVINAIDDNLIALDTFDFDTQYRGISLISISEIDEISWDREHEKKIEKFSNYKKDVYDISELKNIFHNGTELCEIYRQGNINHFLVGLSRMIDNSYCLVNSLGLLGNQNGYVLIHSELLDYFAFRTKYLKLYQDVQLRHELNTLASFLEYLKKTKATFYLLDYNGKEYDDVSLDDYDDKTIFFTSKGKKHKLLIEKIDIIDTRQ